MNNQGQTLWQILSQVWEIFKGMGIMIWQTKDVVDNNAIFGIRGEIIKAVSVIVAIVGAIALLFKRRR